MDSYSQICLGSVICLILTFIFAITSANILPQIRKRHDEKNKQIINFFRSEGLFDIPDPKPIPKYTWETILEILSWITSGMSISFFISMILID